MPNNLPKSQGHSNPKTRIISASPFLTRDEMMQALSMYADALANGRGDFAEQFAEAVIRPNLERINIALGQQNDPLCLALAIERVLAEAIAEVKAARRVN